MFHAYRKYGGGLNGLDTARVEVRPDPGQHPEAVHEVEVLLVDGTGARWGSCGSVWILLFQRLWRWRVFLGQVIHNVHERLRPTLDGHLLPHTDRCGRFFWADCTINNTGVRLDLKETMFSDQTRF